MSEKGFLEDAATFLDHLKSVLYSIYRITDLCNELIETTPEAINKTADRRRTNNENNNEKSYENDKSTQKNFRGEYDVPNDEYEVNEEDDVEAYEHNRYYEDDEYEHYDDDEDCEESDDNRRFF